MSSLFARVVKQALLTFERENCATFKTNFNKLKQLVDQLTATDLGIPPEIITTANHQNIPAQAPVKYIEIFEHKTFTMSVFIINNKYTMPMHDHPGHGLLRVLSGTARVQSYTIDRQNDNIPPHIVPAVEEPSMDLNEDSECSVLTPTKCNLHEITAIGRSSAAFFDILSPPYESMISLNGPKKCLFYRKLSMSPPSDRESSSDPLENRSNGVTSTTDNNRPTIFLQQIRVPKHYYCDNIYYNPPEFLSNLNILNTIDETVL